MHSFAHLPIDQLLRSEGFACGCGKHHHTELRHLALGPGALAQLPAMLHTLGARRPFIVMDTNTRRAAGQAVCDLLGREGIAFTGFCFEQASVEPNEHCLGQVMMAFDPACDLVMAVGAGTINDICKMVGNATGRRLVMVGTAPSMDGYASDSSSMISGGIKVTIDSICPVGIIADTQIIAHAPARMLQAGVGDILAKYVSVCEWRISNRITGEYYCPEIARMMRNAVRKCSDSADALMRLDPQAVGNVLEGLILSGIAMSFAGFSRPASGLEHYFSHIWDMRAIEETGKHAELHGIQVGVGTLLSLRVFDRLRGMPAPDARAAANALYAFDEKVWAAHIHRVFGASAPAVLAIEAETGKHDPARVIPRMRKIIADWPQIQAIIAEELPGYTAVYDLLAGIGAPLLPADIRQDAESVRDAMLASMEIRDKYIASRMLNDLGLLHEMADWLADS